MSGDVTDFDAAQLEHAPDFGEVDRAFIQNHALVLQGLLQGWDSDFPQGRALFDRQGCRGTGRLTVVHAGDHIAAGTRLVGHVGHGDGLSGDQQTVQPAREQAAVRDSADRLKIRGALNLFLVTFVALAAVAGHADALQRSTAAVAI